jgi:hypothetical protein
MHDNAGPARTPWLARAALPFIAFAGVLLPIVALLVATASGILEFSPFNPIPTPFHAILIGTVPLSNLVLLRAGFGTGRFARGWAWLHAFSIGISLVYTVLFLPALPVGVVLLVLFGLGLLLLAPVLSLIASLMARRHIRTRTGHALPPLWAGFALALAALLVLDGPGALTRIGMHMATADTPSTQANGVRWLRAIGSEPVMLELCHPGSRNAGGIVGAVLDLQSSFNADEARAVFFKVTGTSFSSHAAPLGRSRGGRSLFDLDRGGEKVGQRLGGVRLESSRIDGSVDGNAALGYLEWTMTLRNDSSGQEEGRAELLLPPGAVVTRATLWIGDDEHEAAFGGRGEVRAAYQKVVRAQRDPLLVTTSGPGRVLVQMFPVPPNGSMKIRIGMTAPLQLTTLQRASMPLPMISERNFEIDDSLRHAVSIESSAPLDSVAPLRAQTVKPGLFALRGDLAHLSPGAAMPLIEVRRTQPNLVAWSRDQNGDKGNMIVQSISADPAVAPRRVALVIDGSASLAPSRARLLDALDHLPLATTVLLVFADDEEGIVFEPKRNDSAATRAFVHNLDFKGGRDNSAALLKAWEWIGQDDSSAIVWVHGAQPDAGVSTDLLLQLLKRRPRQATLYDMQATPGPNAIAARIEAQGSVAPIHASGNGADDLPRLFDSWHADALQWNIKRERQLVRPMSNEALTSSHLARLWAFEQVRQIASVPERRDTAIAMARTYQLVTPVSGAVVLETKAQYDEAGLEPVKPGSVPTIPEPETWAMLAVVLIMLGVHRYRRRRT